MNERGEPVVRIKDLLGDIGQRFGMTAAVETGMVWSRWQHIVGPAIAEHAEPSSLKGGRLRVRVDSPAWATEIGYLSDQITASVNRAVGVELVHELQVWIGPGAPRVSRPESRVVAVPRPAASAPTEAFERARQAWARAGRHRV